VFGRTARSKTDFSAVAGHFIGFVDSSSSEMAHAEALRRMEMAPGATTIDLSGNFSCLNPVTVQQGSGVIVLDAF
jgi:hypothetical protein